MIKSKKVKYSLPQIKWLLVPLVRVKDNHANLTLNVKIAWLMRRYLKKQIRDYI